MYRTWEIIGGVKSWQTVQIKAIGKEKFGEQATVSTYAKDILGASVNIGEENFGKYIAHNSPNSPIFPLPNISHVRYIKATLDTRMLHSLL